MSVHCPLALRDNAPAKLELFKIYQNTMRVRVMQGCHARSSNAEF
ncbi:hypothetical protein OCAR_6491 [Afipia carboxidovorans OM5]|nr:hypothetical protein OCAR_6491 [Afipia carboxidovorans OM5]